MPQLRLTAALCLLMCTATLGGCTMWKQAKTATWSNATAGEDLERLFWQDMKAKKWAEVEKHIAPIFVSVTPGGTFNRAAAIDHLRQLDITDYTAGDFATQLNGDSLIVTYTITVRGSYAGHPLPGSPTRMMSVWQQLKKGWVMTAHSDTPVAQP